ncbi:hypothetical protein [Brucella sp.]|uniref:hypothetical protein n=1 Tax=Brucella sp. TaxID=52132 RepID=UPI00289AAD8B|nr:hypothetical protein [Brucella sp.]
MAYDPSREPPRLAIVNGYEVMELPDGGFVVMTKDGKVIDLHFPTYKGASDYAGTLPPGPCH